MYYTARYISWLVLTRVNEPGGAGLDIVCSLSIGIGLSYCIITCNAPLIRLYVESAL